MNVTLGELFHITSGGTPLKSCKEYYGGNIPWVKTGDLKEMYLQSVDGSITELGLQKSAARMYKPGTVLLAMYGATIGAASILRISATTNQACAAFIKNEKILPEYLYYFLSSRRSNFIHDGVGGAQPNISIGYLKQVPIDLPNISRQKEITDILGRVSILIKNNKCILAKLDALAKARFIEMFGDINLKDNSWGTKRFEDICEGIGDGLHGTPKYDPNGRIPFINGNNLDGRIIQTPSTKYVNENEYNRLYIHLSDNAILMSINGTLGKLAYYNGEKVCLGKSAAYFNIQPCYNRVFVHELMRTDHFQDYLENNSTQSTIKNVGLKALRDYQIILPPIALQNQFAAFVQQVDKSKSVLQKLLEKQELLRAALMQEYFG